MFDIVQSDTFRRWHEGLRDRQGAMRVTARIRRLSLGNPGDVKPVGHGISELRVNCGPGYRVYYVHRGPKLVVLLAGGDKSSQFWDIERALSIATQWKE
ncbi:type II toxin-antitoxin system RelE/ParE family toxin [Luteibacter sp. Sphag1AF]|uniref:type II toxin-antitoxin system RelE/ParE family toxin n=1 Tax=Luteibacter sp. Sphag1AF TaxID=2587031 RepID=UPI00160F1018|nr:type II toxin-antitoxin system RelE/ParE family toxin [Luteibacter sp. Sphag1AF]